ncbi:hypothetical protein BYT27DRAFT_7260886 [Phlegmacium glaucopus]|nr:hypothetical protein BYT27DRAFT_7260886 [Phlegmacium glaucopus]
MPFHLSYLRRLQMKAPSHEDIKDLKSTASSVYGGGTDSRVSAEYAFFLVIILYPDVQKKARVELDSFIDEQRLPGFVDPARHIPMLSLRKSFDGIIMMLLPQVQP